MLNPQEYLRVSKTIAHALRHAPEQYGLTLDAEGWISLDALISTLRLMRVEWSALTSHDIEQLNVEADKQRYQINGNRIRAFYGHTIDDRIQRTPAQPPELLYHGTVSRALDDIMDSGLLPMNRLYVHLSADQETARVVGSRHQGELVILTVHAGEAHANGVKFYHGGSDVWLSNLIPPKYLSQAT